MTPDATAAPRRLSRWKVAGLLACLFAGIGAGAGVTLLVLGHAAPAATRSAPTGPAIGAPLSRQYAPPFTLTDQNGAPVSLTAQKGHLVLLAFMDPRCVQLCPVLGRDISALEQQLPKWIHPDLLIVSVTAGRSAADVSHFVSTNLSTPWSPGWHWLIGPNEAALKLTWLQWGIPITPPHDNLLAVIDPHGYLRVEYPAPLLIDDALAAVTKVARQ